MDDPVAAVDAAMGRIRRSISQRRLGRVVLDALAADLPPEVDRDHFELSLVGVLDAIDAREEPGAVTVGDVARFLGLDPSGASRLVAGAVRAGLVERVADPGDARRVGLRPTAAGRAVGERFVALRRARFAAALAELSAEDRAAFARLLTAFVDGIDREVAR